MIDCVTSDVQAALKNKGFDPGHLDGVMGTRTHTAILAVQKSNRLEPTGMLDEKTPEALGLKMEMGLGMNVVDHSV